MIRNRYNQIPHPVLKTKENYFVNIEDRSIWSIVVVVVVFFFVVFCFVFFFKILGRHILCSHYHCPSFFYKKLHKILALLTAFITRWTSKTQILILKMWNIKLQTRNRHLQSFSKKLWWKITWSSSRENLSSGFATRVDSDQPGQPQKLGTGLKLWI